MSAIGPKRTSLVAPHIAAFGGKADITTQSLHELINDAELPNVLVSLFAHRQPPQAPH